MELNKLYSEYQDYIQVYNRIHSLTSSEDSEIDQVFQMIQNVLINKYKKSTETVRDEIIDVIDFRMNLGDPICKLFKKITSYDITETGYICPFWIHEQQDYEAMKKDDANTLIQMAESANCYEQMSYISDSAKFGALQCCKSLCSLFHKIIPLSSAIKGRNKSIIKIALEQFENSDDKSTVEDFMDSSIETFNMEMIKYFHESLNMDINLELCAKWNNFEAFLYAIETGCDKYEAFQYSSLFAFPSLTKYFIDLHLDLSHKFGISPLHNAVKTGNYEITEMLVSAGFDVDVRDWRRNTPLHFTPSVKIAALLLSKGADIMARNINGITPLHEAAKTSLELTKYLISQGADKNAKTIYNDLPINFAAQYNAYDIEDFLKDPNSDYVSRVCFIDEFERNYYYR
ncbi:hypothetical protein TVAG_221800 [Trichomonas vaginalis G3]|uniref:DUF3447 domain-containing protein n=1 Tax=Trichomonas vaginalis (strain ATCC PRA-98 / G3) TaxID=412133 RepID=A2E3D6_TRIV3|nr:spectrin binding [Trichomonas vaginalis G3]EAY12827.1 hypothetical protein TVAG_221800 [Trichomonas vaginalis G3]KAI5488515.1 spectrin binding [Trichomonas vaginalis G3]|eukprot:XP_001325050.1 hypothetical protein [Trichomonas vaginalis G3]